MLQRITCLLAGFLLAALLTEVVLYALPYSTGFGTLAVNAQQPIVHGIPGHPYTYSRDWSFHFANSGVLNNLGFRSEFDFFPDPDALAVIGNSFVQADALHPGQRMTEVLGSILGRKAYAVAGDGFSLADYLAVAQWTVAQFHTRTLLILLTTEDLVRSCQQNSGQHYLRFEDGAVSLALLERPTPSFARRVITRSSLFRYLFDNLHAAANWSKDWKRDDHGAPATLTAKAAPVTVAQAPGMATTEQPEKAPAPATGCGSGQFQDAATRYLLDAFRQVERENNARIIFILAPDYRQRHTAFGAYRDVDAFADEAAKEGFGVARLKDSFAAAERAGVAVSLIPIDRHWNAAGNTIAAKTVAEFMQSTAKVDRAAAPDREP